MPEERLGRVASVLTRLNRAARRPGRLCVRACREVGRLPQRLVRRVLNGWIRPIRLRAEIRHIHGPRDIPCGPDELIVISVVRNGERYIDQYIEHHLSLGARHMVFLDNGSTDNTVRAASRHGRVTVLQSWLPYAKYENVMKTYLARRFSRHRWNLCCDIDELFDYPFSDRVSLAGLLSYLDARGFTAVVTQLLDLFSDCPLSRLNDDDATPLDVAYPYYDLSGLVATDYEWSRLSNEAVKMHFGGIRRILFGTENGLTKAALVFVRKDIRIFEGWHHAVNALVADFTCVLRHYPFTSAFYEKVREAAATGRYGELTTDEYRKYWGVLAANPDLSLYLPTARRYSGTDRLIEEGFLVVSPEFREWAQSHPRSGPGRVPDPDCGNASALHRDGSGSTGRPSDPAAQGEEPVHQG
ncbi:MAG TPA: glycosyltransferase family 2 protein [Opitutaceae bacterium]|nr:glycosyltransferase family 2 protein [Opitutaceae bacterium]